MNSPTEARPDPSSTVITAEPSGLTKIETFFAAHTRLSIFMTLLLAMIGVVALSRFVLLHQSLRLDEAQSMWQTSHSIGDTLHVVAQDVHVPLYHVILHFWQLYFGNGVATVRLLSLGIFLVTIPLVYLLGRQILTAGWALFAAVIFSFLPFMDWYSSEARMYTLLAFFATLSQLYFIRLIQGKAVWRKFGLIAMIGAYSHYFFSFNLATQGLFFLINRRRFPKGSFKRYVVVAVFVVAALLPWLLYFHALGSGKNTSPSLTRPSSVDFFNVFSQFIFGFQDNYINTILVSCWPLLVLVAFFAIRRGQRISTEVSYMLTAALGPVIIAYLTSFIVNPFFLSRYMISSVAPLVIMVVWLISKYPRKLAAAASLLLVTVVVITSIQQYVSAATPVKEDYHAVATTIMQHSDARDVVVLSAPFTVYPFEYYYHGAAQIQTLPLWDRQAAGAIPPFSAAKLPSEVKQLNKNHDYVYLVLSQNQGYENTIKQYYLHHFKEVSRHSFSPDLTLYVFQVGYYNVPTLGTADTLIKTTDTSSAN
jgi:mannosyltransferase